MSHYKTNRMGILCILTFLGTYGLCYLGNLAADGMLSYSMMSIFIAVALFLLLNKTWENLGAETDKGRKRKRICYAFVISFLFGVTMIVGYQLQYCWMTDGGVKGKSMILLRALCLAIAVFPFANALFAGIEKIDSFCRKPVTQKVWKAGAVFGISAGVIFLCLIPVWLAYYPVIMSCEFHRQVNEAALGFQCFWPYQPIAHTWIIWVFLQLGYALGDLEAGMAGMALLQMVLYSLVTGYAVTFVSRLVKKKWPVVVSILFFGVFPLNTVLLMCTTKDVIFSILFLLFVLLMGEYFLFAKQKKAVWGICLVLAGSLMVQFRNNAWYAVAVFALLWLVFTPKKEKLQVLLLGMLLVMGGKGTEALIKAAIGTEMTIARVEMYSVPIQQFARVGYCHADHMDQETWELINTYVPSEFWEDYHPAISDPIKNVVAAYTWSG